MKITGKQLRDVAKNLKELNNTKYKMEQISKEKHHTYKQALDDLIDAVIEEYGN